MKRDLSRLKFSILLFVLSLTTAVLFIKGLWPSHARGEVSTYVVYALFSGLWVALVVVAGCMVKVAWEAYDNELQVKIAKWKTMFMNGMAKVGWIVVLAIYNGLATIWLIPYLFGHGSSLAFEFGIVTIIVSVCFNVYILFYVVFTKRKS